VFYSFLLIFFYFLLDILSIIPYFFASSADMKKSRSVSS